MAQGSKVDFKISDETRQRCRIFAIDERESRRYRAISLELFHFLFDVNSVSFKIYLRVDRTMIEFIRAEEFTKELLDQIVAAKARNRRQLDICVLASEYAAYERVIEEVRDAKIKRLVREDPTLDQRTLEVFASLSAVSQMIVHGGITADVAKRVRDVASLMVFNLMENSSAIATLSRMVIHDPTLYDHSATVAMLAGTIARSGLPKPLSPKELETLAQCGLYHDVGKTCVPSEVLNKPARLTPEEYEVMKTHAALGEEELLKSIQAGTPIDELSARVAGEHHEKFSGKGYPRGRKGRLEEDKDHGIHLFSRIVTIADVYSALLMKRVYKPAYEPQDAVLTMAETAADDYDPELFRPFVKSVVKSLNAHKGDSRGRILVVGEDGHLHEYKAKKPA